MSKYLIAFLSAAVIFGGLDAMWLNWAGPNLYTPTIGEIMAENFNVGPAAVFYLIYLCGMTCRPPHDKSVSLVHNRQANGRSGMFLPDKKA